MNGAPIKFHGVKGPDGVFYIFGVINKDGFLRWINIVDSNQALASKKLYETTKGVWGSTNELRWVEIRKISMKEIDLMQERRDLFPAAKVLTF